MAVEAYIISEPQPFAGFSDSSRVFATAPGYVYGPTKAGQVQQYRFPSKYYDYPIITLNFVLPGTSPLAPDFFPPRMLRIGDIVEVGGYVFLVCDDEDDLSPPNKTELITLQNGTQVEYLASDPKTVNSTPVIGASVDCLWLNSDVPTIAQFPGALPRMLAALGAPHLWPYKIRRQPVPSSDQPLQFPRGIGVDTQASVAVGPNTPNDFDAAGPDTVAIMFDSHGAMENVYYNNVRIDSVTQVFLNVGRFENGNGRLRPEDYDFITNPATDQDLIRQRMARINWLNRDSMWVTVSRAGRVITSENRSLDPTNANFIQNIQNKYSADVQTGQFIEQRAAARQYAGEMSSMGGR
jgi:hypothetical protein